ncbi:LysR family transcriptional regulator [Mitsuaria sp. GD03876]|uniref:LysR family transcriptional regulator n=1 Tax=Mitsuaria sp. GD03876 TaxID=2975399 RepID=UPI00244A34D7|nr:LysR family transcriptional regulator [Mitsuaria sp. GD03876]MDH0867085.1 LysR family transcriptional regulator [Mitsuaria sp. GD03876]
MTAARSPLPAARRAAARSLDYRVDPFDLQLFEAVVASGSITAGAAAMNLSLAAASARLKALEHRVGVRLLDRSKTGAVATDAGRALSRQAHRVLAELDSLHVAMSAFGHGLRGTVRLLGNTAAMAEALPPRLGRFLAAHPDIDVELQEMSSDAALQALREGVADVAIVASHVDTTGLAARPWLEDELIALLPAPKRGRGPAKVRFVDLLDEPFVGLGADSGLSRFLQTQAARGGRVPHHRVRVSSFDAIARLVEAGAGVAVMPREAALRQLSDGLRIARLDEPWARRTLMLCHSSQAPSLPGVRALIEMLMAPVIGAR